MPENTEDCDTSSASRASEIRKCVLHVHARFAATPRTRQNVGNRRRVTHRIRHSFVSDEIIAVKDLHRQNSALRRDPDRSAIVARCCNHARATRTVNVVAIHLIERKLKYLWSRIEVVRVIVRQIEVASKLVLRGRVRIFPDVRFQVWMIDINTIVENGDHDAALADKDIKTAWPNTRSRYQRRS
jgi:hypothetical protein